MTQIRVLDSELEITFFANKKNWQCNVISLIFALIFTIYECSENWECSKIGCLPLRVVTIRLKNGFLYNSAQYKQYKFGSTRVKIRFCLKFLNCLHIFTSIIHCQSYCQRIKDWSTCTSVTPVFVLNDTKISRPFVLLVYALW